MLRIPKTFHRGENNGISWPKSGNSTPDTISDVFGPREYPAHLDTVGYDSDMHRGMDVSSSKGDIVKSPINGSVIRLHETHFNFRTSDQIEKFSETDQNSIGIFSFNNSNNCLTITGSNIGSHTLMSASAYIKHKKEKIIPGTDNFTIEMQLSSTINTSGRVGIALIHPNYSEHISLEYNGTNFYISGSAASGALAINGTTAVSSSQKWLRLFYSSSINTMYWQTSVDGLSFATLASQSNVLFRSSSLPAYEPVLFWKSTQVAVNDMINIINFNWVDDQTVGRYGNWIYVTDGRKRFGMFHCETLTASLGDIVSAGQPIGTIGNTGFDDRSGRIQTIHSHVDLTIGSNYISLQSDPVNPLNRDYFPRFDRTNNVNVTRTTENDPDGVDSWKLTIEVSRGDQDFDVNQISLTGNLATRTINFDTRSGLNSDNDIPKNNGVYIVSNPFGSTYNVLTWDVYFNKNIVGSTFSSYQILDTNGNVVASE